MAEQLTQGICARVFFAQADDQELYHTNPVVQLLSVKKVGTKEGQANANDRYRLIVSDGENFMQAMLATQLNHFVTDDAITKNSIVTLKHFTANSVQDKRLIIVLDLDVVTKVADKIGDPKALEAGAAAGSGPTTPAPAPAATSTAAPSKPAAPATTRPPAQSARGGARQPSIYPIEGLSPYQNNWTIKARVTQKSDVRTYSNQRGEGKLFSVTLMDESGEIKATGFNTAVDELFDKFEEGKVYFVSKARVNLAKKKFSNVANDYELSFERNTEVEECTDAVDVPTIKYSFIPLAKLEEIEKDHVCDVVGIVKEAGEIGEITTKTNKQLQKRELTLVDSSGFSVRLTLWGKQAEAWNHTDSPVIAVKGARVGDFGGRSLSMSSGSTMQIEPDIPEVHHLRGWYDGHGNAQAFQSYQGGAGAGGGGGGAFTRDQLMTIAEVKDSSLGQGDKPEPFCSKATIMHIRQESTIAYPGCPTCNKKVIQGGEGWRCEKCDRSYEAPQYRYSLSFAVADHTGQTWLSAFNDAGVMVFGGMTADELMEIKDRDESKYNAILHRATCQTFNFACRARSETYNDMTRVKYGVSRIHALNHAEEARNLLDIINSPWAR